MKVKKALKQMALWLTALSMAITVVGCGEDSETDPVGNKKEDATKAQLYVGVYNGGLGYKWARKVADNFEEYYKDIEIGDKTGIQVTITPEEDINFNLKQIVSSIKTGSQKNDVILSGAHYYDFIQEGVCADITEYLNEPVYDANGALVDESYTGQKYTLLDRMDDYFVDSYKIEDKYYGFPFEDCIAGLVYDVDLFEAKGWTVPQTMGEFYTLLNKMTNARVTPFVTNNLTFYWNILHSIIIAQYEGVDNAMMNFTFEGVMDSAIVDGVEQQDVPITPENAYLLHQQQGNYEALKFIKNIAKTSYVSGNSFNNSQTNYAAQQEYLDSIEYGKRIAMLLEGDWWENEARPSFNEWADTNPEYGYGERRFAFMPIPVMDGQKTEKQVMFGWSSGCAGFVPTTSKKKDLAALWIQFMHSRDSLAVFTTTTGSGLPYDYELTDTEYDSMTYFGQSVYDMRRDPNVEILRTSKRCAMRRYVDSNSRFEGIDCDYMWGQLPFQYFYNNSNASVDDYWNSFLNYNINTKTGWKTLYDNYLKVS